MDEEGLTTLTEMALIIGLLACASQRGAVLLGMLDLMFPVDANTDSSSSIPADLVRQQLRQVMADKKLAPLLVGPSMGRA